MNQLATILKQAREKKGWTQEQIATKVGIKQRRYGFYETGEREPDFELLLKLVKELGINDIIALAQNVPHETPGLIVEEDDPGFENKGTDYRDRYISSLEKDKRIYQELVVANLTELLRSQRYDRAQLTTLLAVTSRTLAKIEKRDVETVFEETNKAVNDLIAQQL